MTDQSPPPPTHIPAGWYPHDGGQRYWDGTAWTEHRAPAAAQPLVIVQPVVGTNGAALAGLILGIIGFLTTGIPLFIGLILGGTCDVLAIIFSIVGLATATRKGAGVGPAVVGLILGGIAFISIFFGAGTIW